MKHLISLLAILIYSIGFSQVSFEAKLNKEKVGLNESIELTFEMNKDGESFAPPSFEHFDVVGGPNKSISNTWVQGERTYKKTITYYLIPQKSGDLTINEATIKIDNKTFTTQPLKVKVSDKYQKGEDSSSIVKFNKGVHLEVDVSTTKTSVGNPIFVTYTLYVSQDIGVNNWEVLEQPKYKGFDVNTIKIEKMKVENGTYKKEPYRYVVLKKAELKPNRKGTLIIDPLELSVATQVPTTKKDIFGTILMESITQTLTTEKIKITVK